MSSFPGIKPFECDICHNKFSSNVGLQEHKSRHTEARPHKCPHCSRQFRQVSCLRRHVFTHSSDKPFGCQVCQQRFSQMAYLKSHMKVHTGKTFWSIEYWKASFHWYVDTELNITRAHLMLPVIVLLSHMAFIQCWRLSYKGI